MVQGVHIRFSLQIGRAAVAAVGGGRQPGMGRIADDVGVVLGQGGG